MEKLALEFPSCKTSLSFRNKLIKVVQTVQTAKTFIWSTSCFKSTQCFQSCINSLWSYMPETESLARIFLCCLHYVNIRITLTNDLNQIDDKVLRLTDDTKIFFFDDSRCENQKYLRAQSYN